MKIEEVLDFFIEKHDYPCPLTEKLVKAGYQQKRGGYIDRARKDGKLVDYSQNSPSQYWHLMTYYFMTHKSNVFSKRIVCGELIIWMAEVSESVPYDELEALVNRIIASTGTNDSKKKQFDRIKWNKEIQKVCFDRIDAKVKLPDIITDDYTYKCEYWEKANDTRYLFAHVCICSGCDGSISSYVLLYDRQKGTISYGRDNRNIIELRKRRQTKFSAIGEKFIQDKISIEQMFDCKIQSKSDYYDVTSYSFHIKSGEKKKEISFQSPYFHLYSPFKWIIDFLEKNTE